MANKGKMLTDRVYYLNDRLQRPQDYGSAGNLYLRQGGTPNLYHLVEQMEGGGAKDVSLHLPAREMEQFLNGFGKALELFLDDERFIKAMAEAIDKMDEETAWYVSEHLGYIPYDTRKKLEADGLKFCAVCGHIAWNGSNYCPADAERVREYEEQQKQEA